MYAVNKTRNKMYAVKQNKEQNARCKAKQGMECTLKSKTRNRM
jgi:hypothetical protein